MARDETPPFCRGESFYNGSTPDLTVFSSPLNLAGKEYIFEPASASNEFSIDTDNSGRAIRVRCVQNVSGQNLLPGRIVRYKVTKPLETQVDGYVFQAADEIAGVVDEYLPAAGVANNDFFYIIVDGPTQVITATTGSISIAVGDRLETTTGTSTISADAGFVVKYASSPTTADTVQRVGRSELAATTTSAQINAVVHFGATR